MPPKQRSVSANAPQYDAGYDAFIQGLELVGLGLKSCRCELDRAALYEAQKPMKSFNHKYRLSDLGARSFDAEGSFEVAMSESEEKVPAVKMECIFEAHFHGEAPMLREYCERFVASELRLILVPLARQFFFATSAQMAISPVVVPLTTRFNHKSKKRPAAAEPTARED